MCWDLLGNRLRSLAKSAPDNHQRRGKKKMQGRCRVFVVIQGLGHESRGQGGNKLEWKVDFSYNA